MAGFNRVSPTQEIKLCYISCLIPTYWANMKQKHMQIVQGNAFLALRLGIYIGEPRRYSPEFSRQVSVSFCQAVFFGVSSFSSDSGLRMRSRAWRIPTFSRWLLAPGDSTLYLWAPGWTSTARGCCLMFLLSRATTVWTHDDSHVPHIFTPSLLDNFICVICKRCCTWIRSHMVMSMERLWNSEALASFAPTWGCIIMMQ